METESDEQTSVARRESLLYSTEERIHRTVFRSRAVGDGDRYGYVTSNLNEYAKNTLVRHRLARTTESTLEHGLEFELVIKGIPYAIEMFFSPRSIALSDDGGFEVFEHQKYITPKPLSSGQHGLSIKNHLAKEAGNIVAYANRAALLGLVVHAVDRATHQYDIAMGVDIAALQGAWAYAYQRAIGKEYAVFDGHRYMPGFAFGPLAAYAMPGRRT